MIPTGANRVVPLARAALEDEAVPAYLRDVLEEVLDEIETLSEKTKPTTISYSIPSGSSSGSYFVRIAIWEGSAGPPRRQLDTV